MKSISSNLWTYLFLGCREMKINFGVIHTAYSPRSMKHINVITVYIKVLCCASLKYRISVFLCIMHCSHAQVCACIRSTSTTHCLGQQHISVCEEHTLCARWCCFDIISRVYILFRWVVHKQTSHIFLSILNYTYVRRQHKTRLCHIWEEV